jgi:DNA-binding winged helix-turn-helix (wHTH) protein
MIKAMRVLFIDTVLSGEKLLRIFFNEKKERNSYDSPHLINLNDTQYTTENILKALEVDKEMIDKIMNANKDGNLLIIVNDKIKFSTQNHPLNFDFKKSGSLHYKSFHVNLEKEEVYVNNKQVKLTMLEYRLVRLFLNNIKKIISREEIIEYLWNIKDNKTKAIEDNLYTHIKNLKKKLAKSGGDNFIHSVYGRGYIFHEPEME